MSLVAIDPGIAHMGLCVVSPDSSFRLSTHSLNRTIPLHTAVSIWWDETLSDIEMRALVIEIQFHQPFIEIEAMICVLAASYGIPVCRVAARTWRVANGIVPSGGGKVSTKFCEQKGIKYTTHHETDAFCIARYWTLKNAETTPCHPGKPEQWDEEPTYAGPDRPDAGSDRAVPQ